MNMITKLFAVVEAALWYGFFYALLYCIKHDVNLYVAALVLVFLMYAAGLSCPWFRRTLAWKKMLED